VLGFIDYLIMFGSNDNQSKGGGFDRGRILRDESCCSFSVIYLAGGGIIPFLVVSGDFFGKCFLSIGNE
jgi:hypothetical protein